MRIIVPLAGPDFVRPDGPLKAMIRFRDEPLLLHLLKSRPWYGQVPPENYCFVLHDRPETRAFAADRLARWLPGAKAVFLSDHTRGAALSALAGAALQSDGTAPVIVDLADILYRSTLDIAGAFAAQPGSGGIALVFPSENPLYSYLRVDAEGQFAEAAEKRVISRHASAGTYIFANTPVFLRALAHALEHEETQTHRGLFFVCPLFNGVRDQGKRVLLETVTDIVDIKVEPSHG